MAARGDQQAPGTGDGHARASRADRDRAIEVLKVAFVQGRLTKDELDARAGLAFTATTRGEIAAVTADLPAMVTAARPPRTPARARPAGDVIFRKSVIVITSATVLTGGAWAGLLLSGSDDHLLGVVTGFITLGWFMVMLMIGAVMTQTWLTRRPARRLPPRSARRAAGRAPRRPASAASPGSSRGQVRASRRPPQRRQAILPA